MSEGLNLINMPELLCPAGSLDKLKFAVNYGADAVYLGGLKFGLRAAADNFTSAELAQGVSFAHQAGSKVYVVLNGFLHDKDLEELPEFVRELDQLKVDAVIVSDLGVIETVKKHSDIEVHLSTQASCLNVLAAKVWKAMGVKRIVVGREVSIAEAAKIKKEADIEIEMFVHGSMCMAYSGNCTISNYTQGRDSNRGGCAHSCRFEYTLSNSQQSRTSHFMSSKDLNGLSVLQQYIEAGIDSIKVEGRMKSPLYVGTIAKVYSEALNLYRDNGELLSEHIMRLQNELDKFTHRAYAPVNLVSPAGRDTIYDEREHESDYSMTGVVLDASDESFVLQVRSGFNQGQVLEVLPPKGEVIEIQANCIEDLNGHPIKRTKPSTLVRVKSPVKVPEDTIVRARL